MFSTSISRHVVRRAPTAAVRRWMGGGGHVPVPQSQNAPLWYGHTVQKEGWEESMYFYFAAGILLQAAVIMGAPETSIESWARPEAQARLKLASQGFTDFEFGKHYQDVEKQASMEVWNTYASRSVVPGDDDDEEEDDDDEEEVNDLT